MAKSSENWWKEKLLIWTLYSVLTDLVRPNYWECFSWFFLSSIILFWESYLIHQKLHWILFGKRCQLRKSDIENHNYFGKHFKRCIHKVESIQEWSKNCIFNLRYSFVEWSTFFFAICHSDLEIIRKKGHFESSYIVNFCGKNQTYVVFL